MVTCNRQDEGEPSRLTVCTVSGVRLARPALTSRAEWSGSSRWLADMLNVSDIASTPPLPSPFGTTDMPSERHAVAVLLFETMIGVE